VDYCANLTHSRHILEQETKNNPEFKRFLDVSGLAFFIIFFSYE
jgi:hypothetical protein